jgi:hypothetical protein
MLPKAILSIRGLAAEFMNTLIHPLAQARFRETATRSSYTHAEAHGCIA